MNSRAKGLRGEREVAVIFVGAGLEVRGLEGAGDHWVMGPHGLVLHSEVKYAERMKLWEWLNQLARECPADAVPVLSFRRSNGPWYSVLPTERLAELASRHGPERP